MSRKMEYPTVNLDRLVKRRKLHGREHLVVPMTLLVQGVLHGSKGPLFYPQNEICNSAQAWNGVPIVVNHPERNGHSISARSAEVLEDSGIGQVLNARCEGNRLVAEGWFDVEQTRNVDSTLLSALLSRQPVEVSTGLFTDNEPSHGTYNGKRYTHVARNYRPDHLAVLTEQEGACSLKDGCGIFGVNTRNDRDEPLGEPLIPPVPDWKEWSKSMDHETGDKSARDSREPGAPLVPPVPNWKEWSRSMDR